ncbi:MAG: biotin/lipoyl-binding protein, partial [Acidobacteria bacterium]|nr:biotin/lipoyl-binding protein [Acidobacteriota bacterium]
METLTNLVFMTITGFTKTLRALDQSGTRTVVWWFLAAVLLTGALGTWMTLGRVQLDEISEEARIEIEGSAFVVQAPVTGRVVRVNYALGQAVAAGAVLIEIDSGRERLQVSEEQSRTQAVEPELVALRNEIVLETSAQEVERRASRAALDEARAKIQETDAPRKLAERERARTEELSQAGLAPKRDVERATSELERLRTVAATAQSAIARIETEQDKREKEREIRIAAIRSKIAKLEGDRQTFGAGV